MNDTRRRLLTIVAVAPVCLLLPAWGFAAQGRMSPLRLLQTGTPLDEAFAAGATAALAAEGQAALTRKNLPDTAGQRMSSFVQALALARGTRLIGVLAESDHVLFNEALREVGAAVLCEGIHSVVRGVAEARHHFISLPSSQGIGAAVARALEGNGGVASVSEQAMHTPFEDVGVSPVCLQPAGWPALVGQAFALVAESRWIPERVSRSSDARVQDVRAARTAASYFSFAVQT